jgi:hypothetical protein
MSDKNSSRSLSAIFVIILVILVAIAIWYLGTAINKTTNTISNALSPLQHANDALGTQVADFLHPTPTIIPDPITIIHEVRSLARLETIQYSVEQVISAESNQGTFGWLFGQKLLFVAHGIVIAGIDMEKISPTDMRLEGNVLHVKLPAAEIFITTLDNEKSYVFDYERGVFSPVDPNLETTVRQAAEDRIRQAAMDDGVIENARRNAESFLDRFFRALGYLDVIFE